MSRKNDFLNEFVGHIKHWNTVKFYSWTLSQLSFSTCCVRCLTDTVFPVNGCISGNTNLSDQIGKGGGRQSSACLSLLDE